MSALSASVASSDGDTDDEIPRSSIEQMISHDVLIGDDQNDELRQRRSATHSKLCAYESKRRMAYESKLQSSSLYWHAFRTLMHDSLLETQKADILLRGWTHASHTYGASMTSVGDWFIDEKGAPITDAKRKKKLAEVTTGGDNSSSLFPGHQSRGSLFTNEKRGPLSRIEFYREEVCGSTIQRLAILAGNVAAKYCDMAKFMDNEVQPQLSNLLNHLKSEVIFMEKLGDSIMNELETAEDEVCRAWDIYYSKALDFGSTSAHDARDNLGADSERSVIGCSDVWVEEMRYRMAVAFLSSVWEKCSSELSKLFLSMKDAECNRRNQIKELMITAAEQQERLWIGLPATINPILKELIDLPMERKSVEDDVQHSIRERAQAIQRDEAEHKKLDEKKSQGPGLSGVHERDGNFELSSPLVSSLLHRAKVIEKRGQGMMSSWKVSLAVITHDSFLHLFELPPSCKLHSGSAPEVAFQNLIPPVVVPSMEGVKGGVKFPSAKYWFDNLVPSESFALPNCVVSLKDEKNPNAFEIVETILTSGASKMFTKTVNRRMQFRAVTRDEAQDFIDAMRRFE